MAGLAARSLLRGQSLHFSSPRLGIISATSRSQVLFNAARPWSIRAAYATTPGAGNPDIVEQLPSTEDEIDVASTDASPPATSSVEPPSLAETQGDGSPNDWSKSYFGLSVQPFSKEVSDVLMAPLEPLDIEVKPDGLLYLPEIKYRRIMNKAFGPGGWGLAPRSETNVGPRIVSREYALVCLGRLVGVARGEQEYFDPSGIPTATEACKSNALIRCCKDLGVASELWYDSLHSLPPHVPSASSRDPRFIREFKAKYCIDVFVEHLVTKRK